MPKTVPITALTEKQRKSFSCGVSVLDDYLKQFAKGNHIKNIGKTFAVLEEDEDLIGYYTVSMGSVDFSSLPEELRSRLPKYPVPVARIGRLAISIKKQGQGWGKYLLIDALHHIRNAATMIAAFGIVVEAKDERAKAFYMHFGFKTFIDDRLRLILPMSLIMNM